MLCLVYLFIYSVLNYNKGIIHNIVLPLMLATSLTVRGHCFEDLPGHKMIRPTAAHTLPNTPPFY